MLDRSHFVELDRQDPLGFVGARFWLPEGLVYLDGNSLGPLPEHVPEVVARVVEEEWGRDLVRSWNDNDWWYLGKSTGERVASLIGAPSGSVIAGDTTTVALYKAAFAAHQLRSDRPVILTDSGNFPSDRYALESVAHRRGVTLEVVDPSDIVDRLGDDVALVALTHVDYRTGRRHSLDRLTDAAHRSGAVILWDLCHSAGAMDIDISEADMAVGCGYKYLNGGPGAPAFVYIHPRHLDGFENPIAGWWGHTDPFAMAPSFEPAAGIDRVQVGTQPIISLASLHAALEVFEGVDPSALRAKSERLVADFIRLADERLEGFEVITPRQPDDRGSHVSLAHPEAPRVMAALISRGVIGDVRPPNLLRFGLAPAYQRHVDVWDCIEAIQRVMEEEEWKRVPARSGPVT